jgi:hypothetical protein
MMPAQEEPPERAPWLTPSPGVARVQRPEQPARTRVSTALIVAALVWAVLTSAWFSFVPTVREKEGDLVIEAGRVVNERDKMTFVDAHGVLVVPLLLVPIALAAVPLLRGRSSTVTTACGVILAVLSLIAGFSIGLYYMPSALLLLVGAALVEFRRPAAGPP